MNEDLMDKIQRTRRVIVVVLNDCFFEELTAAYSVVRLSRNKNLKMSLVC